MFQYFMAFHYKLAEGKIACLRLLRSRCITPEKTVVWWISLLVVSVTGSLGSFGLFHYYSATQPIRPTGLVGPNDGGDSGPRPVARTLCFTPCDLTDQMTDTTPLQHENHYFSWYLLRHPLGTKGCGALSSPYLVLRANNSADAVSLRAWTE